MNQTLLILLPWVPCSCGGYRLGKSPRFLWFIKGAVPNYQASQQNRGVLPQTWGKGFPWKPEKHRELITFSRSNFFNVEDVFVSTYLQCLIITHL